jgi:hypothetical protein
VAFAFLFAGPPQRHSLKKSHIVAQYNCLTDHYTHPVIDKKPLSDHGSRVNLNPSEPPRKLRQHTREKVQIPNIQGMSDTIIKKRM